MTRVAFFIDGYNVYHAIDDQASCHKFKWLDFSKLCSLFISKSEKIEKIFYFTALATWMPEKVARHRILIRALEMSGIEIVYGEFKNKDKQCKHCGKWYKSHEEKQTDVNIAIHLFRHALENSFDTAVLMSGDSDLIPAVRAFKSTFQNKNIRAIIPYGRNADQLKRECDSYQRMKMNHLEQSMLPEEISLRNDRKLVRPPTWI